MKNQITKLRDTFFGNNLPIKLRLFNLITLGFVFVNTILVISLSLCNLLSVVYLALVPAIILGVLCIVVSNITKEHKSMSLVFCAYMGLILYPALFVFNGGTTGGGLFLMALALLFTFILLEGAIFWTILISQLIEYVLLYFYAASNPWFTYRFSDTLHSYIDIGLSSVITVFTAGIVMKYYAYLNTQAYHELELAQIAALEAANEAQIANKAKSDFLANMSHEIRTPMNAIIGMTNILTDYDSIPAEATKELSVIKSSGENLLGIINDILDFSKIESGKFQIVNSPYNFNSMVTDILSRSEYLVTSKKLIFIKEVSNDLPEYLIGDKARINQIFNNLISNASKFTAQGSVSLTIDWEQTSESSGIIHCTVADTGIGIKKEDLSKLFKAFKQLDTTSTRHSEGSGLGLVITKELINEMGGELHVNSTYRKGTTFSFTIPQTVTIAPKNDDEVVERTASTSTMERKISDIVDFTAPFARVVVVDDNKINLTVADKLMRKFGFTPILLKSGFELLELFEKDGENAYYDLLFIDHMMSDMDGIQTTEKLRQMNIGCSATVPIVAFTANAITGVENEFKAAGMNDVLFKPVKIEALYTILKKWLPESKIVAKNVT